jgi:hypothetical protein
MASKRKLKWLGAVSATLALCAAAAWLLRPAGPPITVETYDRLRLGMTREEVKGLLGGPGGTRQDCVLWMNNRSPVNVAGSDLNNGQRSVPGIRYWYQDSGILILRFDAENRVMDKQFQQVRVSTSRQMVIRLLERVGW